MEKQVAIKLVLFSEKREEIQRETQKLDRSISWILKKIWESEIANIKNCDVNSEEIRKLKSDSPYRNAIRVEMLKSGLVPKGMESFQIYFPESVFISIESECERLSVASWELLLWIWDRNRNEIQKYSASDA